jgi:hypothetical protein
MSDEEKRSRKIAKPIPRDRERGESFLGVRDKLELIS